MRLLRTQQPGIEAPLHKSPAAPQAKENIMRIIAKVIESMLSKDATQQWTGQTSAVASNVWGWNGLTEQTATIL